MSTTELARASGDTVRPERLGSEALDPRLAELKRMVMDSMVAAHSKRNYAKALDDLFEFLAGRPFTRAALMEWRGTMGALSASTVNVRLAAMRKLVTEARRNGMIGVEEAANLTEIPNIRQQGVRLGNWLTREQVRELLAVPDRKTLKGKRDYAILAMLVGCGLRRQELAELDVETMQMREGRWVLADLRGKGGRIRTVAVPEWVKQTVDEWMTGAGVSDGRLLRKVIKGGKVSGETLTDWTVWSVVERSAKKIGIARFGAHDLRRTCAKLCRKNGGDLEQIKFLLGHSSIQTTERYLGSEQEIAVAVNDGMGF
ncbi:MAG: site-specific integrase [Acidobacteriota bacterium]|nr:site-specific integrase [Acidobacteriota bacterium]